MHLGLHPFTKHFSKTCKECGGAQVLKRGPIEAQRKTQTSAGERLCAKSFSRDEKDEVPRLRAQKQGTLTSATFERYRGRELLPHWIVPKHGLVWMKLFLSSPTTKRLFSSNSSKGVALLWFATRKGSKQSHIVCEGRGHEVPLAA